MLRACLPTLVTVAEQLVCGKRKLARCYHNGPVGCRVLRDEAADSLSAHGRRRLRGSSSGRPLAVLPRPQTPLMARTQRALPRQGANGGGTETAKAGFTKGGGVRCR